MPTVKLKARYGTWYRSDEPAKVFYNFRTYVAVRASGPIMHSYLYFTNPFPAVPGVRVVSAKLYLYLQNGTTNGGTRSVSVQRVAQGLSFSRISYNRRPQEFVGATSSVQTTGPLGANHQFEIDVTADLAAVAAGAPLYGYVVTTTAPFTMQLHGANSSVYQPTLWVEYTQPPAKPKSLSPSMGRAVGVASPYVTFDYYDLTGSERLTGVRVQTNPTNNFSTPAWDSGTVNTSEAGLDLSETAFPGTPANGTTWWRVQARAADGSWSEWSDPTAWVYRQKLDVELTSPGPTFSDPTPPVSWTVSSPTDSPQSRYRVAAYSVSPTLGRRFLLDSSGVRTGADNTWTPTWPAGYEGQAGHTHQFVVDVWDSYDREPTPGDGGFSSDSVTSVFTPDATVPPVSNFDVVVDYPRADAILTWTRAETPDQWSIYRDGRLVDHVPGPDLRVTGTAYSYPDHPAKGAHSWYVRPVVNGKAGPAPTVAREVDFLGTWLFDPDGTAVCVQDDRTHDMTMPEISAVHEPLGSDRAVIVTQTLRGYEGTVEGLLVDLKGQPETATDWRAALLRFKSTPNVVRTLVIEDQAIPVVTRNVQVKGAPGRRGWAVSFEFYQQGDTLFAPLEG